MHIQSVQKSPAPPESLLYPISISTHDLETIVFSRQFSAPSRMFEEVPD